MLKKISIVSFILFFCNMNFGQTEKSSGSIYGKVFDMDAKVPIEYANVIVFSSNDSTQITGTITDKKGNFIIKNIRPGNYYVSVQFIGYRKKIIKNISTTSSRSINLGEIFIRVAAINLENVIVEGNRSPLTYQIDKKVLDVSQLPTTISGNAADVLENVPSVTVDIDGNVSLRGSTSFSVLIDGRPSVMDAQDALQQIPASAIQSIEIITNPSAKYDPEGNAGIINIILKKDKNLGLSGIVNANAGVNSKYGGDFIFENKTKFISYNFGLDYNRRFHPGRSRAEQRFDLEDNTSYLNSNGNRDRNRLSFGLRGGVEFNLSSNDFLSIGGRYGTRNGESNSINNYIQWSINDPQNIFYTSRNNHNRSGNYFAAYTNYLRKFAAKGHELSGEFYVSHRNSDESSTSSNNSEASQYTDKMTTESGPSTRFRSKIDYLLPLGGNRKFEAGSQGEIDLSDEKNGLYEFNPLNSSYDFLSRFSHSINSNISELSLYSIYSDEWENFGLQAGIRTEYTYRTIKLEDNNSKFSINRWDFFPSIHTSYKFSGGAQMMASYTRRIDRPHGWELEPFQTWMDANNVRQGNPNLQPEFFDSYELGFQTFFGIFNLSNDFYYRVSHNKVERVRSAYAENITLNTLENIGQDYSLGTEFMLTCNPVKPWNVNLMGNLYDYKVKGMLFNEPFERKSFNWSARVNNGIKIGSLPLFQINLRYRSPSVSSQGRSEGSFRTDLAVKHDIIAKKLSVTFQVRDIFKTDKHESTSSGIDFYTYRYFTHESPMLMLNVRFNFNNYKEEKGEMNNGGQPDNGNDGEDI